MTAASSQRLVRLAPALLSVAGAVYIVLVAVDSRPIADDWWHIAVARDTSLTSELHREWLSWSDRFSGAILLAVAIRLLGATAVNVTPIVLLLLLWALTTAIVRACMSVARRPLPWLDASLLCLLATVAVLATAPSVYDTVGWFSGVVYYLAGVVAACAAAAWCMRAIATDAGQQRRSPPIAFVLGVIAAGFHEVIGTIAALAAILGIVIVRNALPAGQRQRQVATLAATAAGAAVGIAVNLAGAGSRQRASEQHAHVSLVAAIQTAGHNLSFVSDDVRNGVLALALATGVLAWQMLGPVRARAARVHLLVWALFMLLVPWLVTSALTAWGGSTESGDRSPFRAGFLETGAVAVALMMLVLLALSRFPRLLDQKRATLLTVALAAGGLVGLAHKTAPILTAERMRIHALEDRATSLAAQFAAGRHPITIVPAPLLTIYTQSFDLSFAPPGQQRGGIVAALRMYYGIPAGDRLEIVARQPRDYCLPNVTASWVGVQSCQQLRQGSAPA